MREIKFRAYDKPNSEMIYSDKEACLYINTKGALFMYGIPNSEGELYYRDYDIMQYTGIKDKNGTELYESDLIKNERGRTGEIVWHDYAGCWDTKFISDEGDGIGIDRAWGLKNNMWVRCVEVIGNIYEHSELIEIASDRAGYR